MKKKFPPTSTRYCAFCKNETTFKYNRNIGHSCCKECGWHYIPTLDPTGQYAKEKETFFKAQEERKQTPEYIEKKRLQNINQIKMIEFQLLSLSKEALEYKRRCKERNDRKYIKEDTRIKL